MQYGKNRCVQHRGRVQHGLAQFRADTGIEFGSPKIHRIVHDMSDLLDLCVQPGNQSNSFLRNFGYLRVDTAIAQGRAPCDPKPAWRLSDAVQTGQATLHAGRIPPIEARDHGQDRCGISRVAGKRSDMRQGRRG